MRPLTDVFICQFMGQANTLWLMLNRTTIYNGMFELFDDGFVDRITLCSRRHELLGPEFVNEGATGVLTKSSTVEAFLLRTTGAV